MFIYFFASIVRLILSITECSPVLFCF